MIWPLLKLISLEELLLVANSGYIIKEWGIIIREFISIFGHESGYPWWEGFIYLIDLEQNHDLSWEYFPEANISLSKINLEAITAYSEKYFRSLGNEPEIESC